MIVLANGEAGPGMLKAQGMLKAGADAMDTVEESIKEVEKDPSIRTVGYGGLPNALGTIQLDASIMDGATRMSGSVGYVKNYLHVISLARKVMEKLPHVMLVGDGAELLASELGFSKIPVLFEQSERDFETWKETTDSAFSQEVPLYERIHRLADKKSGDVAKGTVTYLIIDNNGHMCGGVSTSGWAYGYPGRLGDSPIIGAGLYVDQRYGAAACTHTGEMTIRGSTARTVVLLLKKGATLREACMEALDELDSLSEGYIGTVVIHALSAKGEHLVVSNNQSLDVSYWIWDDKRLTPEHIALNSV